LHGLDVTTIMTAQMTLGGVITGIIEVFVLGWLFGGVLACFYNISTRLDGRRTAAAKS
jgi:TM2 domain-containing membrane protein YozV